VNTRPTIGLTGGIGSGKSTVAQAFEARGIAVIDADAIAHTLTAPGGGAINAIREAFGATFITPEGALDRVQMRAHAFAQPEARLLLESILHPMIRHETARRASAATSAYRILMIPLLVEARTRDANWRQRYDRILVIDCTEATQISRVMSRSGLTEAAVKAIMASQASRQERLAEADDVIDNDGGPDTIAPQVEVLHQRYLRLIETSGKLDTQTSTGSGSEGESARIHQYPTSDPSAGQ
jgi:dephospho-CoA kinase